VTSSPPVLSLRALSRATLARQLLLEREARPPIAVIRQLVGLQAQNPTDPYLALWSRLAPFDPADVEALLLSRELVRTPLLRGTIHLVTAEDALGIRPLVQPVLSRAQRSVFGKRLPGVDLDALAASGARLLAERAMTLAELRAQIALPSESYDPQAVGYSVSYLVPLVQVPPRGMWTRSGAATWTTTEAWLGQPLSAASIDDLVLRYLAAFGPASVNDVQAWCGLTALREVVERLHPQLLTFRDESGRELFDLPLAPRPDPETPAPVRFLPQYDNVFLGHDDRSRIVSAEGRRLAAQANGMVSTVLVDGAIAATWRIERAGKKSARLEVRPFAPWSAAERHAVEAEGERLLAFVASAAATREVAVGSPAAS
jgi:hypothetical protein